MATVLALAACAGGPPSASKPQVRTPNKVSAQSPAAEASKKPTPAPIPSLGLLLEGQVTVDAGLMLNRNLAQATASGVRILANAGAGLISDNGLGLISDNGLGLIANNGLGYRLAASASPGGLRSIEGMWVSAVSLFDGQVLAGPVATDAEGRYKLGFLKAPDRNIRIVATVPGQEADARFSYATLIAPEPEPVLTSDTTRVVSGYILSVLPGHLQPIIDSYKTGTAAPVPDSEPPAVKEVAALLEKIPQAKLSAADKDGTLARSLSERLVSFADLGDPVYQALFDDVEIIRRFAEALPVQPDPPLLEQFEALAKVRKGFDQLPALLSGLGMPAAEAEAVTERMNDKASQIGTFLMIGFVVHQKEVLAPIDALAE